VRLCKGIKGAEGIKAESKEAESKVPGSILRRLSDSIHRNLTIPLNFAFADILLTASCT